ncbi:uncharacterized protein LOC142322675 [Lycorma delicatula]|uniref:uncharacterized protein LOC142322675 n=1 Tax=Lycorma delicatula TaxID=130591 RepID=UPI003F5143F7
MYRQIRVSENDVDFQRTVWRVDSNEPIQTYQLMTVTYGTAAAPYLATRCLQQLATIEKKKYPRVSQVLQSDFYVDDLLSDADSLEEARRIQDELITMLQGAGFHLRKWCGNHSQLLDNIPEKHKQQHFIGSWADESQPIKMLGIMWDAKGDNFMFMTKVNVQRLITKRNVLGRIASLFDPLGLLTSVIVKAKAFMRRLWELKGGWDDPLSGQLQLSWNNFVSELSLLELLHIPRKVCAANATNIQIHGFSDASTVAYGACVYLRCELADGTISTELICAKSWVAPIRQVSLPRLELCRAVLLSQLVTRVISTLKLTSIPKCFLWSDSTVALAWIKSSSKQWKTFIAVRVAQISELTGHCEWRHVRSEDNPADYVFTRAKPRQNC